MKTKKSRDEKPYFFRFLERQELSQAQGAKTLKYPSDSDEELTLKWPSDTDE